MEENEKNVKVAEELANTDTGSSVTDPEDAGNGNTGSEDTGSAMREPKNRLEAYAMHTMRRTKIMHIIAGVYLAYLGYQLASGYFAGTEGASVLFMLAGVLFIIIGGLLAALGLYGVAKGDPDETNQ